MQPLNNGHIRPALLSLVDGLSLSWKSQNNQSVHLVCPLFGDCPYAVTYVHSSSEIYITKIYPFSIENILKGEEGQLLSPNYIFYGKWSDDITCYWLGLKFFRDTVVEHGMS